jgi:hypothetical protein
VETEELEKYGETECHFYFDKAWHIEKDTLIVEFKPVTLINKALKGKAP